MRVIDRRIRQLEKEYRRRAEAGPGNQGAAPETTRRRGPRTGTGATATPIGGCEGASPFDR